MAILANQAKNITCQKLNRLTFSAVAPTQIFSLATLQKSENEATPSSGKTESPAPRKTSIIHGAAILEKRAIWSKPNTATTVITSPTPKTAITQPRLPDIQSLSQDISQPKGMHTAVAETAIIDP